MFVQYEHQFVQHTPMPCSADHLVMRTLDLHIQSLPCVSTDSDMITHRHTHMSQGLSRMSRVRRVKRSLPSHVMAETINISCVCESQSMADPGETGGECPEGSRKR